MLLILTVSGDFRPTVYNNYVLVNSTLSLQKSSKPQLQTGQRKKREEKENGNEYKETHLNVVRCVPTLRYSFEISHNHDRVMCRLLRVEEISFFRDCLHIVQVHLSRCCSVWKD